MTGVFGKIPPRPARNENAGCIRDTPEWVAESREKPADNQDNKCPPVLPAALVRLAHVDMHAEETAGGIGGRGPFTHV
jgi:hypothetical protein